MTLKTPAPSTPPLDQFEGTRSTQESYTMMSAAEADHRCADCGRDGQDLKTCSSCKSVKYCSVVCQKRHYPTHKSRCGTIHTELLFKDPPDPDDCLLCAIMIPDSRYIKYFPCCGNISCVGCMVGLHRQGAEQCPYCRAPVGTDKDKFSMLQERAKRRDGYAIGVIGQCYEKGNYGFEKNMQKAIEMYKQAANLRRPEYHYKLGIVYRKGELGVAVDLKKSHNHLEQAAMLGNSGAMFLCGTNEWDKGCGLERDKGGEYFMSRGMRHFRIAAKTGSKDSLNFLEDLLEYGH